MMGETDMEMIRKYIKPISADYDSPIRLFYQTDNMMTQIKGQVDDAVYQAVCNVGIDIEKDKLISAIHQDRQRYDEAFMKGYKKAKQDIAIVDIEKIKKGLVCCLSDFSLKCECCVYAKDGGCKEQLKHDVLKLLDGQIDQCADGEPK